MPSSRIWPPLSSLVIHDLLANRLRLVQLADRGVDAERAEQAFHAEGAGFVGDDRHDVWRPERLVAQRAVVSRRTKAMVVDISRSPVDFQHAPAKVVEIGHLQRRGELARRVGR
jgi:hypothetical protein